jgi:ubiquinone/menaquinone biosynthesis C-methylase UbiE
MNSGFPILIGGMIVNDQWRKWMSIKSIFKKILYSSAGNQRNTEMGQQASEKPSEEMITTTMIGGGDYEVVGQEFFQLFLDIGKLKPNEKVLDAGCGLGRMAMPLTGYLSDEGSYEGFDIVAEGINWCKENISKKYPRFNFQVSDVYNKQYNPTGKYKAAEYKFPFYDASFDFVFLTSVFTHLLPLDMENYLREIKRVLRRNGRCFITYFLLNEEALQLMASGQSKEDFKFDFGIYRTVSIEVPEYCIAYNEKTIIDLYHKCGLEILYPVRYGLWCGRKEFTSYQDIIIALNE